MRPSRPNTEPIVIILVIAIAGAALLTIWPIHRTVLPIPNSLPNERYPLFHHIPKYPDGITLRLVMVHDVIHERFPRHGRAWYEERNRITQIALEEERKRMRQTGKPTKEYFDLLDDLGAGLESLGRHDEAVDLMRKKLLEQRKHGQSGRDLYTTFANLGTFLVHWQLKKGFANKAETKAGLQEGLSYIRQAIEVNPQAHFGREIWQSVILEFVIATLDNPKLLLKYDMVGNRLDENPLEFGRQSCEQDDVFRRYALDQNPENRRYITLVGAGGRWRDEVQGSHKSPVPFDEPTLGIIGMWRLGGGANPHFALALGEIMLRVGQRYIAWCSFERAIRMGGRFHGDPSIIKSFIVHCRRRQEHIESQLAAGEIEKLRPRFEKELAFGKRYQKAYHEFEANQIHKGVSIADAKFFDAFHAEHGPIASRSGEEEYIVVVRQWYREPIAEFLLAAGLCAMAAALVLCCWRILRRKIGR